MDDSGQFQRMLTSLSIYHCGSRREKVKGMADLLRMDIGWKMGNLLLRRMLFVTDCKYGLTETDVKHILKMKKGKKFGERKENRSE